LKKIKKNFAGMNKAATFALPSKKWVSGEKLERSLKVGKQ
jgi:hypothetical protein